VSCSGGGCGSSGGGRLLVHLFFLPSFGDSLSVYIIFVEGGDNVRC
jgi:hypothetical protein